MKYVLITIAVVVVGVLGLGWWMIGTVNKPLTLTTKTITFVVAKGEGIRTVTGHLFDQKIISSQQAYVLYAWFTGRYRGIIPGTYEVTDSLTGKKLLELFTTGPTESREVKITIPEGLTLDAISKILELQGVVDKADFLSVVKHPTMVINGWPSDLFNSKPPSVDLEGYLFPDTYLYFRNSPALNVVQKILNNTDQRLTTEIRTQVTASGHSLHEILTMASILEMELKTPADRAMAADIFWRRMKDGMALQSDATVNYITGKGRSQPSIDDTKTNSPYNTYQVKGLPPGPICNPGLDAIKAALKPTPNDNWFYLTAPGGQTIFSKTYEEHLANKRKYLQ